MTMTRAKRVLLAIGLLDVFLGGICLSALRLPPHGEIVKAVDSGGISSFGLNLEQPADSEKLLALTFDDGPHKVYTKKLLDGLRERGIQASFFLVGESIPGKEELIRQMAEDGHFIGVHCYSHVDLTRKTIEESCRDIVKTAEMIRDITGIWPEYIRPPYGNWSEELEECVELKPVFWDIDTRDWEIQNRDRIYSHICSNAGKHQVALLHDVYETSVDAALEAVDTLTNRGYTFVTVDELLID